MILVEPHKRPACHFLKRPNCTDLRRIRKVLPGLSFCASANMVQLIWAATTSSDGLVEDTGHRR